MVPSLARVSSLRGTILMGCHEGGSMKGVPWRGGLMKGVPWRGCHKGSVLWRYFSGQSTSRRYASYWNAFLFLSHPLYIQGSALIRNFTNYHFLKFGTGMLSTSIILRDCLVTFVNIVCIAGRKPYNVSRKGVKFAYDNIFATRAFCTNHR